MIDPGATIPDVGVARAAGSRPPLASNAGFWSLCVIGVVALVYAATWSRLGHGGADHQLVVLLAVPWLLWRRRVQLFSSAVEPEPWLLPVVLALSAAWLVSDRAVIHFGIVGLWPVLALAAVWAAAGRAAARTLAFPLLFLYAALPVWSGLIGPLQSLASAAVGWAADQVGLQVMVHGSYIFLPRDTVYIADECSGVQFFTVAVAIGALVGEVRAERWPMRVALVLLCCAISILFNWIRITLFIAGYLHPTIREHLEVLGHENPGWWIFAAGLVVYFTIVHFLPQPPDEAVAPERAPAPRQSGFPVGALWAILAVTLLPLASWAVTRDPVFPAVPEGAPQIAGFTGPLPSSGLWQAQFQGAAWEHSVGYIAPTRQIVEIYRNAYHQQSEHNELVDMETHLFGASEFRILAQEVRSIAAGQRTVGANRAQLVAPSGEDWIAYYVYLVDGSPVASYRRSKILTGLRGSFGHPVSGVLALASRCAPDCEAIDRELEGLLMALIQADDEDAA